MFDNNLTPENLTSLFCKYERLLYRYSYIYGHLDMDLFSECKITLFTCIQNFHFNEDHFKEQYQEHISAACPKI